MLISFISAFPVAGFVYGLIMTSADYGTDIVSRVFHAFWGVILVPIFWGLYPVQLNEAGVNTVTVNLRIYIVLTMVILYFLFTYMSKRRSLQSQTSSNPSSGNNSVPINVGKPKKINNIYLIIVTICGCLMVGSAIISLTSYIK